MGAWELFFAASGHLPAAVTLLEGLRWPKGLSAPIVGATDRGPWAVLAAAGVGTVSVQGVSSDLSGDDRHAMGLESGATDALGDGGVVSAAMAQCVALCQRDDVARWAGMCLDVAVDRGGHRG